MKALSEGTDNKKRPFGILIRFTVLFAAVFSISAAGIKAENISRTLDEIMPQTEDFDFTRTVMRLSSLADPRLNISVETSRVRSMAAEIKERIRPGASGREAVYVINQYLYEMKGFGFDERANEYILKKTVNPAAVDINNYESFRHVLRKRKGICVSLSMLYLMIADELKLPVFGVFVPGHIFVRYESEMDRINIETTSRGSFVPDSEYESEFNTRFNGGLYGKSLSKRRSLGA
ncbi:MAG: transglutaminase family protein, partial [bacterium]